MPSLTCIVRVIEVQSVTGGGYSGLLSRRPKEVGAGSVKIHGETLVDVIDIDIWGGNVAGQPKASIAIAHHGGNLENSSPRSEFTCIVTIDAPSSVHCGANIEEVPISGDLRSPSESDVSSRMVGKIKVILCIRMNPILYR